MYIDWFIFHTVWDWRWIALWLVIALVMIVVGRKSRGVLFWSGVLLGTFVGYKAFDWFPGTDLWWLTWPYWILWIFGVVKLILIALGETRVRALRHGERIWNYSNYTWRGYKNLPASLVAAILALVVIIALIIGLVGVIGGLNDHNQGTDAVPGTPTPGSTTSQTTTPPGTPPATSSTPATASACATTVPSISVGDKATQDARAAAKASCEAAKKSAEEAKTWADKDSDAQSKANDAQGEAESAEHFYNDALAATNVTDAKAAANSAATAATKAATNAKEAKDIANGTYVPPASADDDDTTVPPPSTGNKGEGTTSDEASQLFPATYNGKYADAIMPPLKNISDAGMVKSIRSDGRLAAGTAYILNRWGGADMSEAFPVLGGFKTVKAMNTWVADCRTGNIDFAQCEDTVDAIADIVDNDLTYFGLVRSSTKVNLHESAMGFSTKLAVSGKQEKGGYFLAYGVTLKTGKACIGFNVGTASSGVNGGDQRPAVLKTCVKTSVKHTVPQGKGAGSGKTTHVVHHKPHKVVHHKPPHHKPPTHKPPHHKPVCDYNATRPSDYKPGRYVKLAQYPCWKKVPQSHDKMRDGGDAGAKQPVQDNSTSGVDTGPSTTGPEPTPAPVHTGGAAPGNNGTGSTTTGGTGTSPGGVSNTGGNTETGGTQPDGPADDTGQGGTGNGPDPDPGGF